MGIFPFIVVLPRPAVWCLTRPLTNLMPRVVAVPRQPKVSGAANATMSKILHVDSVTSSVRDALYTLADISCRCPSVVR